MSLLRDIYNKSFIENQKQLQFWEDYSNQLKSLDFKVFSDKLKVPTLVPIGSRILMKGELIHTNELTVALGADYFTKCSIKQADILRQHRIADAESKLHALRKEREYLEKQLTFSSTNAQVQGQEILEPYIEEEDNVWRERHRENVRKNKQNKVEHVESNNVTDEEIWNRLEELELQEELENEYHNLTDNNVINEYCLSPIQELNDTIEISNSNIEISNSLIDSSRNSNESIKDNNNESMKTNSDICLNDKLQKALDKQHELETKLLEMQHRNRGYSRTERDLMERLDELEELDDFEDELERVDDLLTEESEEVNQLNKPNNKIKRSIYFFDDEDEPETLELTFKHSDISPDTEPYDEQKGIVKPSDVYKAYPELFKTQKEAISILKKSKYVDSIPVANDNIYNVKNSLSETYTEDVPNLKQPQVLKNVVEKVDQSDHILEEQGRKPSLFKMRRSKNK